MTTETINGTDAVDTITFTTTSTTVNAGEGANTITATSGDNVITSGDGVDTIAVTSGNNKINAGAGANTITATSGINVINTGDGADTITTGGVAGGGNTINAGDGANTITTGAGNDTVTGGNDVDTITTGAGDDVVDAGNGANTITTGAGNDTVYSGVDIDTITTGAGDDVINIKGGKDTIAAGAGNDTLIADLSLATSAVSINALAGTAAAGYAGNISGLGIATFAGVENFDITSGDFNDTITTGDGNDVVHAGAGSDIVNLAGGNDEAIYTMASNTGATDVYQGGEGDDTLALEFTETQWNENQAIQTDIANYQEHLASGSSDSFEFTAFGLEASEFENLSVRVGDGDATDATVATVAAVAADATVAAPAGPSWADGNFTAAFATGSTDPWNAGTYSTSMNTAFGASNWDHFNNNNSNIFENGYDFVWLDGGARSTNWFENFVDSYRDEMEDYVDQGGTLLVNAARWGGDNGFDLGFGASLNYGDYSRTATLADGATALQNGPHGDAGTSWTGNYFSHDSVSGSGISELLLGNTGDLILGDMDFGDGHVLLGGMTADRWHNADPQSEILEANILDFAASFADDYAFI